MTKPLSHRLTPVVLLCLIAAWAFIARPSLPRETDAELHVFRTAELAYAIRGGDLYPRWAADFYYGYGYPIFNYYAPLSYYVANTFALANPNWAVHGAKAVFVLTYFLGGLGVYGFTKRLTGQSGGVVAAACYLFAPYIFLINPHMRGVMAEFFALGLAPLALWALATFHDRGGRRWLAGSTLATAALILSHNILALVFFGVMTAYTLWVAAGEALSKGERLNVSEMGRRLLPLGLALLISAFFWLNVALESSAVQLSNLVGPGHFDFRNHFISLSELLSPVQPLDLGAVNPAFRFNLGLAQWVIAVAGAAALFIVPRKGRPFVEGSFFVAASLILTLFMTRASLPLWDAVPLLSFVQFPWRLLGPTAIALAVVGSYVVTLLPDRLEATAALLALPLLAALPVFVTPTWQAFGATDRLAMLEFELAGRALGTTSTGDFVPAGVDVVPPPQPSVIEAYRRNEQPERVNRATLPAGAEVRLMRQRPAAHWFAVSSPEDFVLRLYLFDFAGWRATVDSNRVPIETAKPEGWITVPVPAGEHDVRVWLGPTPARLITMAVSALGVAALVFAVYRTPEDKPVEDEAKSSPPYPVYAVLGVFIVIALVGGVTGIFQPRSEGIIARPAENRTHVYMQGGIDLIGYDVPVPQVRPGDSLPVSVYWKAREPVPGNYQVFVHMTTEPEALWAQSDKLNPGDYPTTRWPLDRYVIDTHEVYVPYGTPPGTYTLRVGLWDRSTGARQLILAEDGTILGDTVELDVQVTVLQPLGRVTTDDIGAETAIDAAPDVTLLRTIIEPEGEFTAPLGLLRVNLWWQAANRDVPNYATTLRLSDAGETVLETTFEEQFYPPTAWASDEIVREIAWLWIGENVPAGEYTLEVGLVPPGEDKPVRWIELGAVTRSQ